MTEEHHPIEAFPRWWAGLDPAAKVKDQESVARLAWDGAIRAAWITLEEQKMQLVRDGHYEQAARVQDCRGLLERLFATPTGWGAEQYYLEECSERCEGPPQAPPAPPEAPIADVDPQTGPTGPALPGS